MKVIFLEDCRKIKIGDIVEVKDGYAKNYLIPNKKVIVLNQFNTALFEKIKAEKQKESQLKRKSAEELAKLIDERIIDIICEASNEGTIYASIGKREVLKEISKIKENNSISLSLDQQDIEISYKVKNTGIHKFTINLFSNINVPMYLNVARNKIELEKNIQSNPFKKPAAQEQVEQALEK